MLASLAVALGCMMAAALAGAEPCPSDLAGRWVVADSGPEHKAVCPDCLYVIDISPCGNGWCGIKVKNDKSCDRTVLQLDAGAPTEHGLTFSGRYALSERAQPYIVKARLYVGSRPGRPQLLVYGSTDGGFFARNYPLQIPLVRDGDAVCRAEAKTS
jgi:hypothetical protein